MNAYTIRPFSRKNIMKVTIVLVLVHGLTALAIQSFANGFSPDTVAQSSGNGASGAQSSDEALRSENRELASSAVWRAAGFGFAASDDLYAGLSAGAGITVRSPRSKNSGTSLSMRPRFIVGASGNGFYSHP
jgi:hypothetical protein